MIFVTVRNFLGFAGFLKYEWCNLFYDQYRDFFHPQKVFSVMIWFFMLFDTIFISTICFLQLSYDNNLFLKNRPIHFHIYRTIVITPVKWNQLSFPSIEINKHCFRHLTKMKYQKIINLIDTISDNVSKFITKKWLDVHDQSGTIYIPKSK